jgi:hypothetical protein
MIKLGDKVKDTITGFTGIAVARTEWISGCARIVIQPSVGKEGKLEESQSFDEPLVEVIKPKKIKSQDHFTGGPRPTAMQKLTPKRI